MVGASCVPAGKLLTRTPLPPGTGVNGIARLLPRHRARDAQKPLLHEPPPRPTRRYQGVKEMYIYGYFMLPSGSTAAGSCALGWNESPKIAIKTFAAP